jgi:hypothetical protein
MAGMVPPADCSSFPRWGSGGAPVADWPATGRSLGTQDHRIERADVSGGSHPAGSGPGNHRSYQAELQKLFLNQRLHEATLPNYHSDMKTKRHTSE